GDLLCKCFGKAWFEFSSQPRFSLTFLRSIFTHFKDNASNRTNSPLPDFKIGVLCRDQSIKVVVVECKNWAVPQWLDPERFRSKVGKKYDLYNLTKAFVDRTWLHWKDDYIRLLVLTNAVKFTSEVDLSPYTIERVD